MREWTIIPKFSDLISFNPALKACFFDMDGTLFNTEHLHMDATKLTIQSKMPKEISDKDLWSLCYGQTDSRIFKHLKRNYKLELNEAQFLQQKAIELDRLIDIVDISDESIINPAIPRLLSECKKRNLKLLVVTSSEYDTAIRCLTKLGIIDYFESVIGREQTSKHKPNPAPYLLALERVGLNHDEIIIFEDSLIGLAAAQNVTSKIVKACWY